MLLGGTQFGITGSSAMQVKSFYSSRILAIVQTDISNYMLSAAEETHGNQSIAPEHSGIA